MISPLASIIFFKKFIPVVVATLPIIPADSSYSELRGNDIIAGLDKGFFRKFFPIVVATLPIIPVYNSVGCDSRICYVI